MLGLEYETASVYPQAISTTGHGESIMKSLLAGNIAHKLPTCSHPNQAILTSLESMTQRVGGDGGAICISSCGQVGIEWNSDRMSWASLILDDECNSELNFGCLRGQRFKIKLSESIQMHE